MLDQELLWQLFWGEQFCFIFHVYRVTRGGNMHAPTPKIVIFKSPRGSTAGKNILGEYFRELCTLSTGVVNSIPDSKVFRWGYSRILGLEPLYQGMQMPQEHRQQIAESTYFEITFEKLFSDDADPSPWELWAPPPML